MLNFVKKMYRKFFEFWLWFNLIVCTVSGGVGVFYLTRSYDRYSGAYKSNVGLVFLGVIIGFVFGFMSDILFGGLIATFLNIDANLEKLSKGNVSSNLSIGSNEEHTDMQKEEKIENETTNNNSNNTGKIKLIVEREDNVIYSAMPLEICIDKRKAFSIENASKAIDYLDNGSHSMYASLDYNTQSEVINFSTDNPEIKFKLSVLGVGKIKLEKIVS